MSGMYVGITGKRANADTSLPTGFQLSSPHKTAAIIKWLSCPFLLNFDSVPACTYCMLSGSSRER